MKRIPAIKTVMTPFPYSIKPESEVAVALDTMNDHGIHHLPVTEGDELTGTISSRDIHRRMAQEDNVTLKVSDIMSTNTYTVDLSERLDRVLQRMADDHLDSVLVTRKGKLAGIFTLIDAYTAFADFLHEQVRRSGGNTAA